MAARTSRDLVILRIINFIKISFSTQVMNIKHPALGIVLMSVNINLVIYGEDEKILPSKD